MVRIVAFLLIFITNTVFAVDLAVMLFSSDAKAMNELYDHNFKDLGFKRLYGKYQSDYHVSIGYIDDVEEWDVEALTKYLNSALKAKIEEGVNFEFGSAATLGKATPYLVAIPKNANSFVELNNLVASLVENYQHHKYHLKKISKPGSYIPHMSLNAQVYKEVVINDLSDVMIKLNQRLTGKMVRFDHLVIR